jgi:hypothetical protein
MVDCLKDDDQLSPNVSCDPFILPLSSSLLVYIYILYLKFQTIQHDSMINTPVLFSDLQLAAELGKTLLERNKELENLLRAHQRKCEDQKQEIEVSFSFFTINV